MKLLFSRVLLWWIYTIPTSHSLVDFSSQQIDACIQSEPMMSLHKHLVIIFSLRLHIFTQTFSSYKYLNELKVCVKVCNRVDSPLDIYQCGCISKVLKLSDRGT